MQAQSPVLLEVCDLQTQFHLAEGTVYAVNGVSYTVHEGEVLGVVGESGCGKSVTALSIMRLIQGPIGQIVGGKALLHEEGRTTDLLTLSLQEMEEVRGNKISMVFQDPMTSFNPVLTIGYQLAEPLKRHRGMSNAQAMQEAVALLDRVGIPEPEVRVNNYPHQFSGGMRQRAMVAMAMACRPKLLIADEPTTALDVTIQAQILDLIRELRTLSGTAVIIITHDLGVVAEMADQVAVMYAGLVVENGSVLQIFESPRHPYTQALMSSIPRLGVWPKRLHTIEGAPPDLHSPVTGCPFAARCEYHMPRCDTTFPTLGQISQDHLCACWRALEGELS